MVTETESVTTFPCSYCGRKFVKDSLEKHEAACQKISAKKRKPFDSGKQRATGSDVNYKDVKKVQIEKEKNGGVFARPKTNWKERHETFIEAVSSSKQVEIAIKTGQPLPPPPKAIVPKDYVGCEYCGRNFAEKAAERHIPFCKEQYTRKQGPVKRAPSAKPMLAPAKGQSNVSALRTREPSPLRMNPVSKPPAARRPSLERPQESAQSRQVRSTNNSATSTVVRSNLPLPSKRSTSAPRNPLLGNRNNSKPPTIIKPVQVKPVSFELKPVTMYPKMLNVMEDLDNNYYDDFIRFKTESVKKMVTYQEDPDKLSRNKQLYERDFDFD